jgi:hypothetical protein
MSRELKPAKSSLNTQEFSCDGLCNEEFLSNESLIIFYRTMVYCKEVLEEKNMKSNFFKTLSLSLTSNSSVFVCCIQTLN